MTHWRKESEMIQWRKEPSFSEVIRRRWYDYTRGVWVQVLYRQREIEHVHDEMLESAGGLRVKRSPDGRAHVYFGDKT